MNSVLSFHASVLVTHIYFLKIFSEGSLRIFLILFLASCIKEP